MTRLNRPISRRAVTGPRKEYIQLGNGYQIHHYLRMDGGFTAYLLYRYSMIQSFRYEKGVKIDFIIEDIKSKIKEDMK